VGVEATSEGQQHAALLGCVMPGHSAEDMTDVADPEGERIVPPQKIPHNAQGRTPVEA